MSACERGSTRWPLDQARTEDDRPLTQAVEVLLNGNSDFFGGKKKKRVSRAGLRAGAKP